MNPGQCSYVVTYIYNEEATSDSEERVLAFFNKIINSTEMYPKFTTYISKFSLKLSASSGLTTCRVQNILMTAGENNSSEPK